MLMQFDQVESVQGAMYQSLSSGRMQIESGDRFWPVYRLANAQKSSVGQAIGSPVYF